MIDSLPSRFRASRERELRTRCASALRAVLLLMATLGLIAVGSSAALAQSQEEPAEAIPAGEVPADPDAEASQAPEPDKSPTGAIPSETPPPENVQAKVAADAPGQSTDLEETEQGGSAASNEPTPIEALTLPPHLERLDRLLSEPPAGAVRLLMEELAQASRTPELSGFLRGFATLGGCFEAVDCDLQDDVMSELARLAAIGDQPEIAERLDALQRLGASLTNQGSEQLSVDPLEELARFAATANPRKAARLENLAVLDSLLRSGSSEAEILNGVATYIASATGEAAATEMIADTTAEDSAALGLQVLADFSTLLRSDASEDEVLDGLASLMEAEHQAATRLEGLAELSRVLSGNAPANSSSVQASFEMLAHLLQEADPDGAARVRLLAVVNSAFNGPTTGASRRALIALADLFPAVLAAERERLLATADLDAALESQDSAAATTILRQASAVASLSNPVSASTLTALAAVIESTAHPAAVAIPAALESVATLFEPQDPAAAATVRDLGTIGSMVHSPSDKAVPKALERADRGLSKKSPEAASAFGDLARRSEHQLEQTKATGDDKSGSGGGLLKAILLTGAAAVVGQENAAAGDALARVATGESVKRSALQGAIDMAEQGELDSVIGDTGATLVGGLSEGMLADREPPGQGSSGTSSDALSLAPGAIRLTNANHGWTERGASSWIFGWRVTVSNTTDQVLDITVFCSLDTGAEATVVLASDAVDVRLDPGQAVDIPLRTFAVTPTVGAQANSVELFARRISSPTS